MLNRSLSGILLVLFAGCTVTRTVHLYPISQDQANAAVLQGVIIGHGQGHGTAKVTMPDGEILLGEYSIVFGGSVGFGTLLGSVYGPDGVTSVNGSTASVQIDGRGQGSASLVGDRGTSAQCEFLNSNMTGHGYGACRSSKGNVYKMLY